MFHKALFIVPLIVLAAGCKRSLSEVEGGASGIYTPSWYMSWFKEKQRTFLWAHTRLDLPDGAGKPHQCYYHYETTSEDYFEALTETGTLDLFCRGEGLAWEEKRLNRHYIPAGAVLAHIENSGKFKSISKTVADAGLMAVDKRNCSLATGAALLLYKTSKTLAAAGVVAAAAAPVTGGASAPVAAGAGAGATASAAASGAAWFLTGLCWTGNYAIEHVIKPELVAGLNAKKQAVEAQSGTDADNSVFRKKVNGQEIFDKLAAAEVRMLELTKEAVLDAYYPKSNSMFHRDNYLGGVVGKYFPDELKTKYKNSKEACPRAIQLPVCKEYLPGGVRYKPLRGSNEVK